MKSENTVTTLPERVGDRPKTGKEPPHLQFSDISPKNIYEEMSQWALVDLPKQIPFIRKHPTLISVPSSEALWLDESIPTSDKVFMPPHGSREFAHLHKDGSWHLVVDESLVTTITNAAWGERHPWYDRGVLEVLVYAPRNEEEVQIVQQLVVASIEHASQTQINAA